MAGAGALVGGAVAAGASILVGASVLGLGVIGTGLLVGAVTAGFAFLDAASTQSSSAPGFDTGPTFQSTAGRTSQIRQAISARQIIYGESRVSGPLVYVTTTDNNSKLHLVIALAGHEIESIDDVIFNDVVIHSSELDSSGNVIGSGFYSGHAKIRKHLGTTGQSADADLVNDVTDWTTNHRLSEIAYLYVRLDFDQDTYPTGIPSISCWVKGKKILDTRDSVTRWSPNPALVLRDYLTDAKLGMGAAASEIDDTFTDSAANICDEMVATVAINLTMTADAADDTLTWSGDTALAFQTGDRVQVTTSGTLPGGIVALTNYFVIVTQRRTAAQIQLAETYANAIAGTALNITDAGSGVHIVGKLAEPRYTANGFFNSGETPVQTIENILSSMGGRASNTGGTWRIRAGAFVTPTLTFDETDMRGPLSVQTRHPRRVRFNAVHGVYASPLNSGIPTDFPPVTNATYLAADNAERLWLDRNLPFTSRTHTAQRLAKIELERHRQEISVAYPVNLTGLQLEVGDTVNIDNTRMGWSGKDFEVVTWALVVEEDDSGAPLLGVDLGLRETASAVFDWNSGEETAVDPAPNTTLPDPFTVAPPTGLTLTSGTAALFLKADGTVVSRIKASWTAPADSFVAEGGRVELQFKKAVDAFWVVAIVLPGAAIDHLIFDVEDGVSYDVRVRSVNHLGVRSDNSDPWSATITGHVVVGKTAAPSDVATFVVATLADGTRKFEWTVASLEADVRAGGGYQIRFSSGGSLTWASGTKLHEGLLLSTPFESNELAAGQYTFGIKAFDSSDNESTNDIQITATLGDPRLKNVLVQRVEHSLQWPGTLTDCFIAPENVLEAVFSGTPADDWDSLASTWNALADTWRGIVGNATPLRYETPVIDIGTDATFTPQVTAEVVGTLTVEMRTHSDAEGSDVSGESYIATAQVISERYIQLRISVAGTTPVAITMTTLLDGEVVVEEFEDINTATEAGAFFNSIAAGNFEVGTDGNISAISQAQIIAIQGVTVPFTWTLVSKTAVVSGNPAAEFKVFNDNGTLTDAVVDVSIKGPKS